MKNLILLLLLVLSLNINAQAPQGYYDPAAGKYGTALKQALHDIIDNHTVLSYDFLITAFETTDKKSNGKVWDMYSDIPGGTPPMNILLIIMMNVEAIMEKVTAITGNIPGPKAGSVTKRLCIRFVSSLSDRWYVNNRGQIILLGK